MYDVAAKEVVGVFLQINQLSVFSWLFEALQMALRFHTLVN